MLSIYLMEKKSMKFTFYFIDLNPRGKRKVEYYRLFPNKYMGLPTHVAIKILYIYYLYYMLCDFFLNDKCIS